MAGYTGERYPAKARKVAGLILGTQGKTAVGCTTIAALTMYRRFLSERFPSRPLFVIAGNVSFKQRQSIISNFESTANGYENSIEQNMMALVLTKERLNEFVKSGEIKEQSAIFDEFNITQSIIDSLLKREKDDEGKFHIRWGYQQVSC